MLTYFSCDNFRSINEKIELNLRAAPRLRRHKSHVRMPLELANKPEKLKVLKSAVLYGANASGKSNILKAIAFAKFFIINSIKPNAPIKIEPFKITSNPKSDSSFYFEFSNLGAHFCFGFRVNAERVLEETLSVFYDDKEMNYYHREWDGNAYKIKTGEALSFERKEHVDKLTYMMEFTPKNKLFLSEFHERDGLSQFDGEAFTAIIYSVYLFFRDGLIIIFPNTKYFGLFDDLNDKSHCEYLSLFKKFDTGISDVNLVAVDLSSIPKSVFEKIDDNSKDDGPYPIKIKDKTYFINPDPETGDVKIYEIMSQHKGVKGDIFDFSLNEESDGTVRLLDLLPALIKEEGAHFDRTYVIDEFDRSIHPILAKQFIELFMSQDNDEQLIASTHQSQLLDNSLLRRDEIWFVQKEWDSSSKLYSLDDYAPRFDRDLQSAYLDGFFGAIPQIIKEFKR